MQTQKSKGNNKKILAVTLRDLHQIISIKENFELVYKNIYFEYIVFVARLVKNGQMYTFSDETQILSLEAKRTQQNTKLKIGCYYECLCQLKSMNTSFQPCILNLTEVDGNFISTHLARLIRQSMESNLYAMNTFGLNTSDEPDSRSEEMEGKMRRWIKQKQQFTLEQLENQFQAKKYADMFATVLTRLEDEGYVGNMGDDSYRYID